MSTLRVAHFSDTHVLSLAGVGPARFLNKRVTGAVNLLFNRARQYRVDVFERLLGAIVEAAPDHCVCTGDLVNLALEPEFERVSALLRAHFPPDRLTLVPGNHDYYVADAAKAGHFERFFADYQPHDVEALHTGPEGAYPVVRLLDGLAVVGLSTAMPTPVFMATGLVGAGQLEAVGRVLRDEALGGRFRLLIIHHPLLPDPTRPLDRMRRLQDAPAVIEALRGLPLDLVVHGHNHEYRRNELPGTRVPVIQVGSASRHSPGHHAEFNVYVIRGGRLIRVERHIHDPARGRFFPHDELGRPLPASAA